MFLCLGLLLSTGGPHSVCLFSYNEYCINTHKEDRRNSEDVTLDYKLLSKVFSQEDEGEKEDTLDLNYYSGDCEKVQGCVP